MLTIDRRRLLLGAGLAVAAGAVARPGAARAAGFAHPGMLHTSADLTRIKAQLASSNPVVTRGWQRLVANGRSQSSWTPRPLATVIRGGAGENYAQFFLDVHAAYQNALRWRLTGDTAHADTATSILNAWSRTLTSIAGDADRFLAAGIYGYEFANAAELMRGYDGFDLAAAQKLLRNVFYPLNDDFLQHHNGACISNYWANWDLCTVASVMATGILCDDSVLFERAVAYFKTGPGNGSIGNAVPFLRPGGLGQWQESGRDQGHTVFGVGLAGVICEMAWNQGVDLYGYDDSRFLKGAEYVARYNLGHDVPFTTYRWNNGVGCVPQAQTVISAASRGQVRPVWELIYNHYAQRRGLAAPNVQAMAALVRAEGGGGDYGTASGGYDQLGFGTLLFTRSRVVAPTVSTSTTTSLPAVVKTRRARSTPSRVRETAVASPATTPSGRRLELAAAQQAPFPRGVIGGVAGAAALAGAFVALRVRRRRR